MNTEIVDFLKNTSNQNILKAKENIHSALAAKISDALVQKEFEIRNSLYNQSKSK